MRKDVFDGFNVNVFLDEDGDYLAHFVEMPNVSAFSDTPEGALRELAIAWKGVKESYQKHHEPIPKAPARREDEVPFKVTIDAQLYHDLTDEAAKAGVSLYVLVVQKLKSTVPVAQERVEG
jgi:predicted RNase H-like HicB family nuclease